MSAGHNARLDEISIDQATICDDVAKVNLRYSVLMEAENIVNGPRRAAYGHPRENFGRICDLWNAYLRGRPGGAAAPITPEDHALMMVLLKVARLQESPEHRDSVVDICGYAGTYEFLLER